MAYQLKIKSKELAAEAKANKFECRKMLEKVRVVTTQQLELETAQKRLQTAREHLAFLRSDPNTPKHILDGQAITCVRMSFKVDYFKAKLRKSRPSDETIKRLKADAHECRLHRLFVVKPHARATHVAYGYLKGRTYQQMEANPRSSVNWQEVARMVYKYGSVKAREEFPAWLANIGFSLERIPDPKKPLLFNYRITKKAA